MAELAIFNMEANRHLGSLNHLVGNTWVIGVKLKAITDQALGELLVV
jgi:hypothetical protein